MSILLRIFHRPNYHELVKRGRSSLLIQRPSRHMYSTQEKSRLRKFYDEYGKLGIGVYLGISVLSVSSIYTAIRLGIDVKAMLERLGLQDNTLVAKAGPLALAYGIHKLLAPARLVLAFILTPVIKRRFFTHIK